MPRRWLLAIALALVAGSLIAQNPVTPDLSGTWTLNLQKSRVPKYFAISSEMTVIACSSDAIQIHFTTDGKESDDAYMIDGRYHVVKETPRGQIFSRAEWKKSVLVTETSVRIKVPSSFSDAPPVIVAKESWALSGGGRVLTRESDDPRQVLVYDKQ